MEPQAKKTIQNKNIGISISNENIKMEQYSDDASMLSDAAYSSLVEAVSVLKSFLFAQVRS